MQKNKQYITNGPLLKSIINFALPIMFATVIANLFHSADMMILGNMADLTAVASVGATGNIIALAVTSFTTFSIGPTILLSRAIGANEPGRIKRIVDTSMYFSLALGIAVAIVGNIISVPLLRALNAPQDCFDGAVTYLRIYMLGVPPMLIYNFGSAVIRAEGDSRRPLIYVIISGIVNVTLNYILCLVLTNKVAAVAISTAVSQVVGAVLVMVRLLTKNGACRFTLKKFSFSFRELGQLMRFSVPHAIASLMYPIANLQITGAINSYGSACVAGFAAAANFETITASTYSAFSSTLIPFMNQNMGAGNTDRVKRSIYYCMALSVVGGTIGLFVYLFCPETVMSLYVPGDIEAIAYGVKRMQYILAFQMISACSAVFGAAIQSFGYPTLSSVNSIISVLGLRIVWMNLIYPMYTNIDALLFCFTFSWILIFLINALCFTVLYVKFVKKTRRTDAVLIN